MEIEVVINAPSLSYFNHIPPGRYTGSPQVSIENNGWKRGVEVQCILN